MKMRRWVGMLALFCVMVLGNRVNCLAAETVSDRIPVPQITNVIRYADGTGKLIWGKKRGVQGYEISYSGSSKVRSDKTRRIRGADTTETVLKKTEIYKKKDTFLRVRAYKNVKGKRVYSQWSTKARIVRWKPTWKYGENSQIHTGSAALYYSTSAHRKGIVVAVNAGHGTPGGSSKQTLSHPDGTPKVTGGSNAKGVVYSAAISEGTMLGSISEAEGNLRVAEKLKKLLLSNGYDVLMLRQDSDQQLDNIARTVIANHRADLHVAIHFDSSTTDKGAFYIGVPDISSYRNMSPVKEHYKEHDRLGKCLIEGLRLAKVKILAGESIDLDLTQTSYSTIPSMDIEVGDRATSVSEEQLNKIARGLLLGIRKYTK